MVIVELQSNGEFKIVYQEDPEKDSWQYIVIPDVTDNEKLIVSVIDGSVFNFKRLQKNKEKFELVPKSNVIKDFGLGEITPSQVIPPYFSKSNSFLILDNIGRLFIIDNVTSETIRGQLLNTSNSPIGHIADISIGFNSDNLLDIYCTDASNTALWRLSQSNGQNAIGASFSNWVPLGDAIQVLSVPRKTSYGSQVFYYGIDKKLKRLSRSPDTTIYFTDEILVPKGKSNQKFTKDNSYVHEFSFERKSNSDSEQIVKVTSDRPAYLVIQELGYQVTPSRPAFVKLNMANKISIYSKATTLSAPKITLTAADESLIGHFRSDTEPYKRLAGQDPKFKIDGGALKKAGILPSSVSQKNAENIASSIKTLAGKALDASNPSSNNLKKTEPFSMFFQFSDDGSFTSSTAFPSEIDRLLQGNHLEGFRHFLGDVFHAIKHDVIKVIHFGIKILEDELNVIINGVKYVLKAVEEISDAMVALLAKIAKFLHLDDLLNVIMEFIRKLLGLDGALHIQQVITSLSEKVIDYASEEVNDDLPQKVSKLFKKVENDVEGFFNNIEKHIDPNFKISDHSGRNKSVGNIPSFNKITKDLGFLSAPAQFIITKGVNLAEDVLDTESIIDLNDFPKSSINIEEVFQDLIKLLPLSKLESSFSNFIKLC